jgi:hypothetical protein
MAFATAILVGGCNDNGVTKPDAGNDLASDGGGLPDFSGFDFAGGPKGCGAIFDCVLGQHQPLSLCEAGKPGVAVKAFAATVNCMYIDYCGDKIDDAAPTQACAAGMVTTDAGLASCNQCVNNTLIGPNSFVVDANNHPLPCVPTNAPECGVCAQTAFKCIDQCFTDADCMGLMPPLHCINGSGMALGTCG